MNDFSFKLVIVVLSFLLWSTATYSQVSDGGTAVASPGTVCADTNTGTIALMSSVGDVLYWEYSISGSDPWITISYQSKPLPFNNLQQTTYFRAIVKFGATDQDTSTIAVVQVSSFTQAGNLVGNMELCGSGNSGTLNLSNYNGNITHWEYSNNQGITWNTIANTNPSYSFNNLSSTNWYRAVVQSGACSEAVSNTVVVTVFPPTQAGTLSGSNDVCALNNNGELVVSGYTGDIVRWESSQTGFAPWSSIDYQNDTLAYTNLLQTHHFRALVKSGVCQSSYTNAVEVHVSPVSHGGIVSGQQEVCASNNSGTLVLSDYTGTIMKWQYSFDYGTTWNDTANVNHTLNFSNLNQTTTYRAVVQSGACATAYSEICTIVVHPTPDVGFTYDTVCYSHATNFVNNSSISAGSIVSYSWDFGNGDGNSSTNPVYIYPSHGMFTVKLVAVSNHSCIDSIGAVVPVYPSPVVGFYAANKCHSDTVFCINNSFAPNGGALDYEWNFGDGSMSDVENPNHLFPAAGNYSVGLIVTQVESGCRDSVKHNIEIYPRAIPNFITQNQCDGTPLSFNNTTYIEYGSVLSFWAFGDGSFADEQNPGHLYNSHGEYIVILTATTNRGCVDTIAKTISVHPQPTANFSFEDVCFTDTMYFVDNSNLPQGNLYYHWNFGNSDNSNEASPTYYYQAPGTYSVTLSVNTDSACQSSISKLVNVYALPNVNFVANNECLYNEVNFENLSVIQQGSLEYVWDFGDGNNSNEAEPQHLYNSAGTFMVKLIATVNNMCADSVSKQIVVYPIPEPMFSAENVCDGEMSYFFDESSIESGSIANYSWDFGDGTNSVQQNPVKQYLNPGTYQVVLNVESYFSCQHTYSSFVTVDYMPVANFSVSDVCDGIPINPQNQSLIQAGNMFYQWNFGDMEISIVPNPNHIYNTHGIYRLVLQVQSENGCTDSLARYVQVFALPNADAGQDVVISKGDEIRLSGSGGALFTWFPSSFLSNATIANPVANPLETIEYILQAEDTRGCVNSDTVMIEVLEDFKIKPNNIITPDGNGINDTWYVENIESYGLCEVFVFDRIGNMVFQTKSYANNWKGENMNGDILPDGTYYYAIVFENSDVVYKGSVSILRNN